LGSFEYLKCFSFGHATLSTSKLRTDCYGGFSPNIVIYSLESKETNQFSGRSWMDKTLIAIDIDTESLSDISITSARRRYSFLGQYLS